VDDPALIPLPDAPHTAFREVERDALIEMKNAARRRETPNYITDLCNPARISLIRRGFD
jgi:hypothetical protein